MGHEQHDHGTHRAPVAAQHATHDQHAMHDQHGGHDKHAGHSVAMFRDRFWVSLLLTVPILVWSETVQDWFNYAAPTFPLADRIPAIFGTVVFLYGGLPFLRAAYVRSGIGNRG